MSLQHTSGTGSMSGGNSNTSALVFPVCTNPVLRLGLESILSETGFIVWHEILDGFSTLPAIEDEALSLFIIDGGSFNGGAIDIVRRLRMHAPAARIVLLADNFDRNMVSTAWNAGAHGFCLSTHRHDVLVASLELVMLGEVVLPATIVLPPAGIGISHLSSNATAGLPAEAMPEIQRRKLSAREAEILVCLKDGAPNKVIARKLNLSEATVKVHVKTILKKLGACNRTQAALWATRYVAPDQKPL